MRYIKRLPAEWERQSGVQLTWPHRDTPWYEIDKVIRCYTEIAAAIAEHELVLIVTRDIEECKSDLKYNVETYGIGLNYDNIRYAEAPINDTWARDHGGIAVLGVAFNGASNDNFNGASNGGKYLLDFVFNGWGLKFGADLDNQITKTIFSNKTFAKDVNYLDMRPYVLEGGSIDCDGEGTLLTTTRCLCSLNRNEYYSQAQIEQKISEAFGLKRVLWVDHGEIIGDDTDSHIDTLARFCNHNTIAYTQCTDPEDPHYEELLAMEEQLKTFRTLEGDPYNLVPLPLPEPLYLDDYRLPGTYANFLIINGAVLMPGAGSVLDQEAASRLQTVFPDREVKVIDCRPLLSGHGGLHCVTMNFPEGYLE